MAQISFFNPSERAIAVHMGKLTKSMTDAEFALMNHRATTPNATIIQKYEALQERLKTASEVDKPKIEKELADLKSKKSVNMTDAKWVAEDAKLATKLDAARKSLDHARVARYAQLEKLSGKARGLLRRGAGATVRVVVYGVVSFMIIQGASKVYANLSGDDVRILPADFILQKGSDSLKAAIALRSHLRLSSLL